MPISSLVKMHLPGMPRSPKGWYDLVGREQWPYREAPSKGGKAGVRREYRPPPEVQALIDAQGSGRGVSAAEPADLEQNEGRKLGHQGSRVSAQRAPEYAVNRAFPGGSIDAELLARVALACQVVHGSAYHAAGLPEQVKAAARVYNVLLSLTANLPGGSDNLRQLDQDGLTAQVRVLVQMGTVKPWPEK